MSNGKHLTLSDRISIEAGLKEGLSFKCIAAELGKDPSTISKEVRAHIHGLRKDGHLQSLSSQEDMQTLQRPL